MSDKILFDSGLSKDDRYKQLIPQILSLVKDETDFTANIANVTSALKYSFIDFSWVGFYIYRKDSAELVLGPFQGKIACTRILMGKGVCGTAAIKKETVIVADVNKFPGHIFCDSDSKSEIVVPVLKNGELKGVLDIDSREYDCFDEIDKNYLEDLVRKISNLF